MSNMSEFRIDPRSMDDLCRQIGELAKSYTPEWVFDRENPDAGSVIALIFSNQMAENIGKVNQVMEKYRTEFVNMLSISLKPAYPASGVVIMELTQDTVPGIDVPRGTKLIGSDPDAAEGERVIFETLADVHVTGSRLRDVLAVSRHFGKIIPLLGAAKPAEVVPNLQREAAPAAEENAGEALPPIKLFDFLQEGIEKNALLLYHKSVFDTAENVSIHIRALDGSTGEPLAPLLADPARFTWSWYSQEGLKPFDHVAAEGDCVVLRRDGENDKLALDGEEYSLVYLEAVGPVRESVDLLGLEVSSECAPTAPDFVVHNEEDQAAERFLPFGDTASLFDECYIGHDRIFRQQGAMITMELELHYAEKTVDYTPQQVNEELKVIKRKPRTILYETARTCVQRVAVEYYNGTGWRKLNCVTDYSTLFDGSTAGPVQVRFLCPEDWAPVTAGGYEARCIRLRVAQADNCYLQPCIHNMPVLSGLKLSYSYFGEWRTPHRLRRVCGTEVADLTAVCASRRRFTAFSPLPYAENALLLGFDKKMTGAPVSLLFDVEESVHFDPSPLRFEYSTTAGWKPLKVIDHTENMSCVGTVLFMPPADFAPVTIEGQRRWWLHIVDAEASFDDQERYHAVIRAILPNALEIQNVETMPEEQFYVEASTPNMRFPIAAENILSCDVFVNEKNSLSVPSMRQLLQERPEDVRVEYNFLGDISEFFVRWEEVPSFDDSGPGDRHYTIDRMTNTIQFGDGVSVMIPMAQSGVAFTLQAKCCRGSKGNLPPEAVDASFDNILYVSRIYNPIATYAGGDIESIESAHERGANTVSSKNRLVSELDYTREARSFSTAIDKVKCIAGRDIDGRRDDRLISLVVMMRDYADGAYSFNGIKDRLKERLLERGETTLAPQNLILSEPIYVEISVDVWAETDQVDHFFAIQNTIKERISAFLDPLSHDGRGGWDIGELPTESQVRMMLQSIKTDALVRRHIITARYVDRRGVHECSLDTLRGNPFMIGVSGEHRVHVSLPR